MELEGKVALVSGGGTGIGAAIARRFARAGAQVVVTGRRREPLAEVAEEIDGLAVTGDVTDPAHGAAAVAATVERFGGLDVVVANAGTGAAGTAAEIDDDAWQMALDVNLTGVLRLVRAAIPELRRRGGGSVVVVSSVGGAVAPPASAAYVASKGGLIALTRSIAVDFGPEGIRANALCPGWVRTPMADRSMDELAATHGVDRATAYGIATAPIPLRRPADPDEIAACALFLASDASSYVTGASLFADGGTLAVDPAGLAFATREPPLANEVPRGQDNRRISTEGAQRG